MAIFTDDVGQPVKFFIQKDLPATLEHELVHKISHMGGRVEAKVPIQGFILVRPGSPEEERLRACWLKDDRPERYFVPYTYVEACEIAGKLLKQIFVFNGKPMKMHIDVSIANVNARAALSARIQHSGGDPSASAQSARVVLADPDTDAFHALVRRYEGSPDKNIESYLWVKRCIDINAVLFTPLVYKNPGGRRPGEERTAFTQEDDDHLCEWIASKIPDKAKGGRTGNLIYQQLCDQADEPGWQWVTRHTWQSWRERYKKRMERLDPVIAAIVRERPPPTDPQGQYGYRRQGEKRPRKKRQQKQQPDGNDEPPAYADPAVLDMNNEVMLTGLTPTPATTPSATPTKRGRNFEGSAPTSPESNAMERLVAVAAAPQANGDGEAEESAAEDDDDGDDLEWAIRIGHNSVPGWAKRMISAEPDSPESYERRKRRKTTSQVPPSDAIEQPESSRHPVDRVLQDIADGYRFLLSEVREFYDGCGDMDATKRRFAKMRATLAALDDQD